MTRFSAAILTLFTLPLVAMLGCSEPTQREPVTLSITSPVEGETLSTSRVTIRGVASGVEQVSVNGTEASVVGGAWSVALSLDQGEETVRVEARESSDEVTFTIDSLPPSLRVDEPARATWFEADRETVTIRGVVADEGAGVDTLRIGERLIEPDSQGAFSHEVPLFDGLNLLRIEVSDRAGNATDKVIGVVRGETIGVEEPIDPGFDIIFDARAFPKLSEVIEALITPERVSALLTQRLGEEGAQISSLTFDPLSIDVVPRTNPTTPNDPGLISFEVIATNLAISGNFELAGQTIDLDVAVSQATVKTVMTITPDGEGSIDLTFGTSTLDVPQGALTWMAKGSGIELSDADVRALTNIIEELATQAFSEILSERILEQLYDPAILVRTVEVLGSTLTFELLVEEVITNASGVFVRTSIALRDLPTLDATPAHPGALALGLGAANIPAIEADAWATLNRDAIHRLLHGVWVSGLLNQELTGSDFAGFELPIALEAGALALALDGRVTNVAQSSSPAGMRLRPQLPPLIALRPDAMGDLMLHVAELHVDLLLDAGLPTEKVLVTTALFFEIHVTLSVVDNLLSIAVDVEGRADVVDEPLFDLDDTKTEAVLNGLFTLVPQVLVEGLQFGGGANIDWLILTDPEMIIHGTRDDHITLSLEAQPNTSALAPPSEEP